MQIANLLIKTTDVQIIPVKRVTPAEALVLIKIHYKGANGEVVQGGSVLPTEVNSPREIGRLKAKYGRYAQTIEGMWPGVNAKLPQTFAEAGITLTPLPEAAPQIPDLPEEIAVKLDAPGEVVSVPEIPPVVTELAPMVETDVLPAKKLEPKKTQKKLP